MDGGSIPPSSTPPAPLLCPLTREKAPEMTGGETPSSEAAEVRTDLRARPASVRCFYRMSTAAGTTASCSPTAVRASACSHRVVAFRGRNPLQHSASAVSQPIDCVRRHRALPDPQSGDVLSGWSMRVQQRWVASFSGRRSDRSAHDVHGGVTLGQLCISAQ